VNKAVVKGFINEMEKIASRLDKDQRRRQAIALLALGTLAGPTVGGISNLIQHGRIVPVGSSLRRWLPASLMSGALFSGALPAIRRALEHRMEQKSKSNAHKRGGHG